MKTLLVLASLFSLPAQALDFDKLIRANDLVEFTQAISFANSAKYDSNVIYLKGRVVAEKEIRASFRCSLYVDVPANSRSTIQAGRKMRVTSTASAISLESGVTISCETKYDNSTEWESEEYAHITEPAEIMRSLPMLKIHRLPPPAPDNKDL